MSEVPKKRWLKRVFYAVLLVCVLFLFYVPTMLFTDIPPRISKETTYLTEPLTADGKRIDYFLAMEQRRYPPQMRTDDNGARLIAQAFGPPKDMTNETKLDHLKKLLRGTAKMIW